MGANTILDKFPSSQPSLAQPVAVRARSLPPQFAAMVRPMAPPHLPSPPRRAIPQRLPALEWRKPAFLWTPIALALALGWPAWALSAEPGLMQMTLIAGAVAFAMAFVSLAYAWIRGRPPRTRLAVMEHILFAGLVSALLAPFAFGWLIGELNSYESVGAAAPPPSGLTLSTLPLALILGLGVSYAAGLIFALVALVKPERDMRGMIEAAPPALSDERGAVRRHDAEIYG